MSRSFPPLLLAPLCALLLLPAAPAPALEAQFLWAFGERRFPGPDVFEYVSGIGVDSGSGDVYVTDPVDLRRFDRDGNFLAMWSCPNCRGVDANATTGEVYVAVVTDRILRFAPDGTLLQEIGASGDGPGQFRFPHDVAVDSATGNLYVMDVGNARVQQLDAAGNFLREWGSPGSGDGEFSGIVGSPGGIAFDPVSRHVFTSDATNDAIQRFDELGNFQNRWAHTGACGCQSPDEFRWIREIAVDRDGNVLAADADGERVSVWSPTGQYLDTFQGPHDVANGPFHPRGIAANTTTGDVFVAAAYSQRVDKFDADFVHQDSWGDRQRDGTVLWKPLGIAASRQTGDVYVFAGLQFRIKHFSWQGDFLGEWGEPARLLVGGGVPPEGLIPSFRNAVAVDGAGDVWILTGATQYEGDPRGYEAQRFDADGDFLSGWLIEDETLFTYFSGGAIEDATGRVFVSNFFRDRVEVRQLDGTLLHEIKVVDGPSGLAVHDGFLYVLESETDKVLKFAIDGPTLPAEGVDAVDEWGGFGSGPGQLKVNGQSTLDVSDAGWIFVADTGNHRIQVFDTAGTVVGDFGEPGNEEGQLISPHGVSIGRQGVLHVSDYGNGRIQSWVVDLLRVCGDGVDNDGDGLTDLADPQCTTTFGYREAAPVGCGAGPELALLAPLWLLARRRRTRR